MKFEILDVGHGQCVYFVADNGNVMLFDCGHKSYPEFRPSVFLRQSGCTGIERFFVTNFDEDHISDLQALRRNLPIGIFDKNPTITPDQLRALKLQCGPISPAMESLLQMMKEYVHPVTSPPDFTNANWRSYWNTYRVDFEDTNNLSVVTFLHAGDLRVVIPGDMECAGWRVLLKHPDIQKELAVANVFIASHHGREGGYCPEVFHFCRPELIVFSDGAIDYGTQEMSAIYAQHASGRQVCGSRRTVLTTRCDGTITFEQRPGQSMTVLLQGALRFV